MQMGREDFWEMTPREFMLKLEGYNERHEAASQERWEMMRLQTFILLQPHIKKGRLSKPRDLFELPHERANRPRLSPEQAAARLKKWDEHAKNKLNG